MLERRIEEASLNSWPALQQMLFDGWLLRFSGGYTKRANSVTPVYPAFLPISEKVALCEKLYREKQQPTIFRLPSFLAEATAELDILLAQRGYQHKDLSHVLSTELTPGSQENEPALHSVPLAIWLPIFCQLSHSVVEKHQLHREMLTQIVSRVLFAVLYIDDVPVACGAGVLEHDVFGLFDIITAPEHRKKGYGTRLVAGMLAWASQHGASHAYLQVMNSNQSARRLYERNGFQHLYHYWYRILSL